MSQDYLDKLEHVRGVVLHHMYEEESDRFLDLKKELARADQERIVGRRPLYVFSSRPWRWARWGRSTTVRGFVQTFVVTDRFGY
jgi:hypothetical protein